jgi:hypothetical protein
MQYRLGEEVIAIEAQVAADQLGQADGSDSMLN